ncbi:MAG: site-2 protease family protein [Candidatus Hodarchaeales archaeon]|jgi:Zn-dependent protease
MGLSNFHNYQVHEINMFENSGYAIFSQIDEVIGKFFTVTAVQYKTLPPSPKTRQLGNSPSVFPVYEVLRRSDLASNMQNMSILLRNLGFIPLLRPHPTYKSRGLLYIVSLSKKMLETRQNKTTPLILFGLTVLSVFFVGIVNWETLRQLIGPDFLNTSSIVTGILYVIGLIGIVGIHELGHMVASRIHGVNASWPYFIPFPFGYGTFGAFISQKTPIKSRNDLFDVGFAGPIFGFVTAIFFTFLGLLISIKIPTSIIPTDLEQSLFGLDFLLTSPTRIRIFLFEAVAFLVFPPTGGEIEILLHPLALAGYIGLLLTGLNLIPLGQLDGGHVARSLFSEKNHRTLTYISAGLLALLGFWFFAILILLMYSQTGHAGPLDDLSSVSSSRKIVASFSIFLALLCLPIPADIFNILFPFFN